MQESSRTDIRRLLKRFGIQAGEAIMTYLALHPELAQLLIRLVMEDITDYGDTPMEEKLHMEIKGQIRR